MNISWQPPGDGEGYAGQITDYVVNITLLAASEEDIYSTTTQSESVVVGSLHPDYLYQCSVVPRTSAGPGPSTHTLLRLPQDGNPLSPSLSVVMMCAFVLQYLPVHLRVSMPLHPIPQLSTSIGAHHHWTIRTGTSSSMGSISLTLGRG